MRIARLVFPVGLVAAAAVVAVAAERIDPAPFDPVGGRLFPLSVAIVVLALSVMLLFGEARELLAEAPSAPKPRRTGAVSGLRVTLLFVMLCLAVWLVDHGYAPLSPTIGAVVFLGTLVLTDMRGGPAAWLRAAIVPLATGVVLAIGTQLVFEKLLGIPLP
jgi:hypothetical protein